MLDTTEHLLDVIPVGLSLASERVQVLVQPTKSWKATVLLEDNRVGKKGLGAVAVELLQLLNCFRVWITFRVQNADMLRH